MTSEKKTTTTIRTKETVGSALFTKDNYKWMLIGLVVMAIGFFLMAGGKSSDPNVVNPNEVYSPICITLAPILIIAGFILEIIGIMKKNGYEKGINNG